MIRIIIHHDDVTKAPTNNIGFVLDHARENNFKIVPRSLRWFSGVIAYECAIDFPSNQTAKEFIKKFPDNDNSRLLALARSNTLVMEVLDEPLW